MIEFFRRQTDFECVFSLGLLADDHLDGGTGIEPTVQHVPAAQSVVHRRDLARRPQPRFADPLWPAGSSAVHQQNLRRRPERAASTKIRHGRAIHRFLLMRTTWDYFFIFFYGKVTFLFKSGLVVFFLFTLHFKFHFWAWSDFLSFSWDVTDVVKDHFCINLHQVSRSLSGFGAVWYEENRENNVVTGGIGGPFAGRSVPGAAARRIPGRLRKGATDSGRFAPVHRGGLARARPAARTAQTARHLLARPAAATDQNEPGDF